MVVSDFKTLDCLVTIFSSSKSDTPFQFAYILAPEYRTSMFLAREIKQKLQRIFSGHPVCM